MGARLICFFDVVACKVAGVEEAEGNEEAEGDEDGEDEDDEDGEDGEPVFDPWLVDEVFETGIAVDEADVAETPDLLLRCMPLAGAVEVEITVFVMVVVTDGAGETPSSNV